MFLLIVLLKKTSSNGIIYYEKNKGGKKLSSPTTRDSLDTAIANLKRSIERNMNTKQKELIEKWFTSWSFYIARESGFKPHENIKYNAGDIVTVCYGYNVGSEQGGNRPAVVLEDNDLSDKTVMVIPLSSLDEGETEESIHNKNVYLGELTDFNAATRKKAGTKSKALIHQMRTISKQRIIRPVKETDAVITLDPCKLKNIYDKIVELYATQGLTTEKVDENTSISKETQ